MDQKINNYKDAAEMDKKIPQALLMQYQGKYYILKAGLEWKANYLFGGGAYGVTTDIVEKTPDMVLAKATLTTRDGMVFSNYGEASKANVTNPAMHKYLLHMAVTRAECRVLRMATACGYTSYDEMDIGAKNEPVALEDDENDANENILATLKQLGWQSEGAVITMGEARRILKELTLKK